MDDAQPTLRPRISADDARTASDPGNTPPAREPRKTQKQEKEDRIKDSLSGIYSTAGLAVGSFGMLKGDAGIANTGGALAGQSESLADAWLELARDNRSVMAALERFTEVSTAGTLIALHISVLMPFLVDRGIVPAMFAAAAEAAPDPTEPQPGRFDVDSNGVVVVD